jgi:hypothetical protein
MVVRLSSHARSSSMLVYPPAMPPTTLSDINKLSVADVLRTDSDFTGSNFDTDSFNGGDDRGSSGVASVCACCG